jgi:hypothetical protein
MATLYITEFSNIGVMNNATYAQAPSMPPLAEQHLSITTTSAASSTFSARTLGVLLNTDATCSLAWSTTSSTTVSAVTTAQRMAAGETRFYGVNPGFTVAVIANS